MNQSTFQLLGNVASADFYLCGGSDITLISDNNAYNMKALAQEALKLRVPNSLTVIDLNNFYVGMIPIDHNQILTMISHINTTIIPFNYLFPFLQIHKSVDHHCKSRMSLYFHHWY